MLQISKIISIFKNAPRQPSSKGIFLMLVLLFLINCTFAQRAIVNERYVDSVIAVADTIKDNAQKIEKLVRTAGSSRYTKPTKKLIIRAMDISSILDDPKLIASSTYSMGNYYYFNSQLDSCLIYLERAQNYVKDINEPLLESSILQTKGGAYNKLGAVILSISTQVEAKNILDHIDTLSLDEKNRIKHKGQYLTSNNSLANLYNKTEDYEKALEYYDLAAKSALSMGENSLGNAGIIISNKGNLLIKMNRLEEALEVLQYGKNLKKAGKLPKRFEASSDLNIGIAQYKMGEFELALESFDNAMTVYQETGYKQGLMETRTNRGILYIDYKKLQEAKTDCEEGKRIALEINDSEYKIKACECLYTVNNELGNFKAALENHELYAKVKDSVFNEKNIRKITQVGMEYEFGKKEAEQQLVIEKKNRQKNQILTGLIGVGIVAVMLLIFFRKRLKYQRTISEKNKAIQLQKIKELQQENKLTAMNSMIEGQEAERLRIANDLHDSLGGLLSTVKAHFSSIQKEKTDLNKIPLTAKTNELIDTACIEVRRISHNMMPHALSISGLKGAIQDMIINLNEQGYEASFEVNKLPKLESTNEVMIYRLIQEIISNIRKHAEAKRIFIQIFGHKDGLNLTLEDDGKGFDYEKAVQNGGLGLESINSRVAFLDGSIDWDTGHGKGTSVVITLPNL